MRETLKKILPVPALNLLRETRDGLARLKDWPAATFHPWRRETRARLGALRNLHAGQRCFILGNGPSLRQTDLTKLQGEYTIGLNRIFLAFPEMGFQTSYLVSINDLVIEQSAAELQALAMPRFFAWRSRRHFQAPGLSLDHMPTFIYTSYTGPRFSTDVTGRVWEGATVTNVALQLAYHMGFTQVILIGVDHSFASKGEANKTVVSDGDDPNHFSPHYFGKGFRWQLPDLETSEIGYALARKAYEKAGRQVLDATVGGKLTTFPKVDYESLF